MEKITDQIKKQIINSTPKTHFIKLTNIFSIFIFIFFYSSFVSLCSYTHHFTSFNDRHYIFLLCNGILVFLIMNFGSTHSKKDQSVITNETNHQQPVIAVSYAMEPIAATMEEQSEEIIDEVDEIERNEKWVCVVEDRGDVSITQDQFEDQKGEICKNVVNLEVETSIESKEAEETEEFNKRCAEFISKMRERMKLESSRPYGQLQLAF